MDFQMKRCPAACCLCQNKGMALGRKQLDLKSLWDLLTSQWLSGTQLMWIISGIFLG